MQSANVPAKIAIGTSYEVELSFSLGGWSADVGSLDPVAVGCGA
jgi:hypothetical protein